MEKVMKNINLDETIEGKIILKRYTSHTEILFKAKSQKAADLMLIDFFLQLSEHHRNLLRSIDEENEDIQEYIESYEAQKKWIQ